MIIGGLVMKNSFYSAILTLSFFSVLDRLLGFFFKIYLSRELGASALGVYQVALSFFMVLLTATTSGIPLIVSKMTARFVSAGETKRKHGIVSASLILGLMVCAVVVGVVLIFFTPITSSFTDERSKTLLLALLPALFFSAVYSAFRGSLWGEKHYFFVSIVEIIEQIARIVFCVVLFVVGCDKLFSTAISLPVGCFFSALSVAIIYFSKGGKLTSARGEIKPLFISSTPITVTRAVGSLVGSLQAVAVPFLLIVSGSSENQAMALFGSGVGMALPLLYIPITVVGSLAFALIPTVSEKYGAKDFSSVNRQISGAIVFSVALAGAFSPIYSALGECMGIFIYDDACAGTFLVHSAWTLIPLAVENITSSVMNSLDLEKSGFINYCIGSAVCFGVMFAHYGSFDIFVLPTAMGIGWTVSSILHLLSIHKRTGLGAKYCSKIALAVALIFPATLICKCLYNLTCSLPLFLCLAISSLVSFVFYGALCFLFGVVSLKLFGLNFKRKRQNKANSLAK